MKTEKIIITNASVNFPLGKKLSVTKSGSVGADLFRDRAGRNWVRALDGIDLKVYHGDRLAVLGHNGAGKTTLLRTIAGIYEPDNGAIVVDGSVAAQFDVGTGIPTAITGKEFIRIRGLILGLDNQEIDILTKQVEREADLGDFINLPVKIYSSGMRARLLISLVTSVGAQILLFDEAIVTGDSDFKKKVKSRIDEMLDTASVVVVAAHSIPLLRSVCNRGIVLNRGSKIFDGSLDEAIEFYTKSDSGKDLQQTDLEDRLRKKVIDQQQAILTLKERLERVAGELKRLKQLNARNIQKR